ncbi:MAG: hypothetical protein QOG26_1070 [Solirubrobacterales bacterium]|nr:hypothetical protein [Solirubrobacterales bacterium]
MSQPPDARTGEPRLAFGDVRLGAGLAVALALIWAWWGWKTGAYFGTVFYPGTFVLALLAFGLTLRLPIGFRLSGAAAIALLALVGIAGWTALSILWTPTRSAAVDDTIQALAYAVAFVLGLWLCRLLGRRMELAALPLGVAGLLVGVLTVLTLWGGHDLSRYLHVDASLRLPLGYRNANAAFFLIALWPALVLASHPGVDRRLRVAMFATATLTIELAVLSQSRGSLAAAAAGLGGYLLLSPRRLRSLVYLALAALPMLAALPSLLDVYREGEPIAMALPLLRTAARAMALSSLAALVVGALAIRFESRISLAPSTVRRVGIGLTALSAVVVLVGASIYVGARGGPIAFVDQRVSEFTHGGTPDLHRQGARFGTNVGSNRGDFWRVALDAGAERPLGGGAGSFEFTYLEHRQSRETPSDPHSVEMLMLSELGLPGLLLLGAFVGGVAVAILRSSSRGPGAAALAAAAGGAGAYWLMHASYDWFWNYPGLTAPVICLLGAACGPAVLDPGSVSSLRLRRGAGIGLAVLALLLAPLYLSRRYSDTAAGEWRGSLGRAYDDLARARSLDPFSIDPLLLEAEIARRAGDVPRALSALRTAGEREPDNWGPHFLRGRLLVRSDPAEAARELARARQLNPRSPEIRRAEIHLRSRSTS